ncbi:MAG TPA: hypothetical protein VJ020_02565 [Anaerolineales bacterium]|nr:hypothetical protein [Anaerolineales bacterium]
MSKNKKKHTLPNIPAETLLRLRLDGLWQNPNLPGQTVEQIESDMQTVVRGGKPDQIINVMLAAFGAAPAQAKTRLESVLPHWIARQNYLDALAALLHNDKLPAELRPIVEEWLATLGRSARVAVENRVSTFHSAYEVHDEWQTAVIVLWYSNRQRSRARGMNFLIDRNPPWYGALKEIMLLENKMPAQLKERYVDIWGRQRQTMIPISAVEAKRLIVTALTDSLARQIRLPDELILFREQFFEHILTLPDAADTPRFTVDDFRAASQTGQSAEEIARFEKKVGRRIVGDDGQEIFIDANLANKMMEWDRDFWDEEAEE